MRGMTFPIVLILAFIFGFPVAKSISNEMISKSEETVEVNKLIGTPVKNPQGEEIGRIIDIVAGPEGRAAFAVLSYWISADTQKRVAVPFGALSCGEQDCVLDASKERFDSAPTFVTEDDLAEGKLAEDIYRYFGMQPYWTEEGTEK